jgi:hypothetical protein
LAWVTLLGVLLFPGPSQAPVPMRINGDTWLTTNASFDGMRWSAQDPSHASFAFWMSDQGFMPNEGRTGAEGFWVHRAGCPKVFDRLAAACGWNLGLALTQWKSLVVGGDAVEIDGNALPPYGRVTNASDGRNRYIGLVSNFFGDLSNVDVPERPSWLFGINLTQDAYQIRRLPAGNTHGAHSERVVSLMNLDRDGNLRLAGATATSRIAQAHADRWATRAPLHNGVYTFLFSRKYASTPVCVASSEGNQSYSLHVTPSQSFCIVKSSNTNDSSMVDIIVVGNPE